MQAFHEAGQVQGQPSITELVEMWRAERVENERHKAELSELRRHVSQLTEQVLSSATNVHAGDFSQSDPPLYAMPNPNGQLANTAANKSGELPPVEVRDYTLLSFPEMTRRVKGNYYPPQPHMLAAHRMYKRLGTSEGRCMSPTSFVMLLRDSETARFDTPPPVLMALYSGRLGSRGASVMMFKEQNDWASLRAGSSNENFACDFSASVGLPRCKEVCDSSDDLLDALNGLAVFAHEHWYEHLRKLVSRLRAFAAKNKSIDVRVRPERVTLTLDYVNLWLGKALACIQSESALWWANYCEVLRFIDFANPEWTAAQVNVIPFGQPSAGDHRARTGFTRAPAMPDRIRRLIPRNRNGQEPCLRHFSGQGCFGEGDKCTHRQRLHQWPEPLPKELLRWLEDNQGRRARN